MFKQTVDFFQLLGASSRTAHALQNGRKPLARDLDRLGLDEDNMRRLGK